MRIILTILIIMFPIVSNCMEITCYSMQKKIYHGYSENVYYNDNFLIFFDKKQDKSIYIRAECVLINEEKK